MDVPKRGIAIAGKVKTGSNGVTHARSNTAMQVVYREGRKSLASRADGRSRGFSRFGLGRDHVREGGLKDPYGCIAKFKAGFVASQKTHESLPRTDTNRPMETPTIGRYPPNRLQIADIRFKIHGGSML